MKKDYWIYIIIAWIIGIVLYQTHVINWIALSVIVGILFCVIFFVRKDFILFLPLLVLGFFRAENYNQLSDNHFSIIQNKKLLTQALLIEKGNTSEKGYTQFIAEIQSVSDSSKTILTTGKSLLYLKNADSILPNTMIYFQVPFSYIQSSKNPYGFDYQAYQKNKRIYTQYFVKQYVSKKNDKINIIAYTNALREKIAQKFDKRLGKNDVSAVAKAFLLGDKTDVTPEVMQNYARSGTMHLLAISGLHVALIYMFIFYALYFLRFLPYGYKVQIISSLLILILYAMLTGLSPSVCRSSLMISLFQLSKLLQRPQKSLHIIALSAFILLGINPNFLWDVGFQLSYTAVLSMIIFSPYCMKCNRFKNKIAKIYMDTIIVSCIATLGTLPLTLYYFNTFPSLFLVANLALVPIFGFIIGLGIIEMLLIVFDLKISCLDSFFSLVINSVNKFNEWIATFNLHIENICINLWECVALMIFNFLLFRFFQREKYKYLYVGLTLLLGISVHQLYAIHKADSTQKMLVFNNPKNAIFVIKQGRNADFFSEKTLSKKEIAYIIEPFETHERIAKSNFYTFATSIQNQYFKTPHILSWKGKIMSINPSKKLNFIPDFILLTHKNTLPQPCKELTINVQYSKNLKEYNIPEKGYFEYNFR